MKGKRKIKYMSNNDEAIQLEEKKRIKNYRRQ